VKSILPETLAVGPSLLVDFFDGRKLEISNFICLRIISPNCDTLTPGGRRLLRGNSLSSNDAELLPSITPIFSSVSNLNIERIKQSKQNGTWRDWDKNLLPNCYKKESGQTYTSVYGRMGWIMYPQHNNSIF